MCVCVYLALGATTILGWKSHAIYTLEETVREAVVAFGYSSAVLVERGWALKLGRFMFKTSVPHLLTF